MVDVAADKPVEPAAANPAGACSLREQLNLLYEGQQAYMERHAWVSWCDTPFARRIAEIERELGF